MKIRYEDELETTRLGKALREKRGGKTLMDVQIETGIAAGTLSKLERGIGSPELATFKTLMEWIGIEPKSWPLYMDWVRR